MYISPNGEFPKYYGDIQLEHPSWQLGDSLPEGWQEVQEVPKPETPADDKIVVADGYENIDGVFYQKWLIRDMTAEEIERRDAPQTAKAKLMALGLSELEIQAIVRGLVR